MHTIDRSDRLTAVVRRGKWVVLVLWLAALVLTVPFVSQLGDSLDDSNELPADSQAQQVVNLQKQADPTGETADLSVVYESAAGLSAQDKEAIQAQQQRVSAAGIDHVLSVTEPAISSDGQAAYFTVLAKVPVNSSTGPDIETAVVTKVREIAQSTPTFTATTTGTMAFTVDSNLGGADQMLLVSAAAIVAVLLILTYRSALLWLVPLVSAALAIALTDAIVYGLTERGLHVSSLDSSILIVLVFGVATDYGMLLISRYREFLHTHEDKNEAVALALRGSFEAITASAATVALALLVLTFAGFSATKGLGPVAAVGVACAYLVQMTFLPAMLAIGGRVLLWPRAPRFVPGVKADRAAESRLWAGVTGIVSRRPGRITAVMVLLLIAGAVGLTQLDLTVSPTTGLRGNPPSVQGQAVLERHFTGISEAPVIVVANDDAGIQQARQIAERDPGTATVSATSDLAGRPSITIEPKAAPYSDAAFSYIRTLRTAYSEAGLGTVLVGGDQSVQLDYITVTQQDNRVLIPVILLVVAVILGLLLRAVVAPVILLATVVLSFAGSFGLSVFVFQHVFGFQTMDPALPIYIFIFVVALGVDYNIFLMDRARQETPAMGTRKGILKALSVTGGVITAAGLVLAGTFTALAQIPIVNTTQVGVAVALGVIIDSFLVRSFLLPAVVLLVGPTTWWPGGLVSAHVARHRFRGGRNALSTAPGEAQDVAVDEELERQPQ